MEQTHEDLEHELDVEADAQDYDSRQEPDFELLNTPEVEEIKSGRYIDYVIGIFGKKISVTEFGKPEGKQMTREKGTILFVEKFKHAYFDHIDEDLYVELGITTDMVEDFIINY